MKERSYLKIDGKEENKEQWDIECCKCGKYILTEQRGSDNEIRCIRGSYDDGYYNGTEDQFYCKECAAKMGFLK